MDEVVRDLTFENKPKAKIAIHHSHKAIIAAFLAILSGLITILLLTFGIGVMQSEGTGLSADDIEGLFYVFITTGFIIGGGIAIFIRKYTAGGIVCIICGVFLLISIWYLGLLSILAGILALTSREKIEVAIFRSLENENPQSLASLALKLKRTEADIEIAIVDLQKKGRTIKFDTETRIVSMYYEDAAYRK